MSSRKPSSSSSQLGKVVDTLSRRVNQTQTLVSIQSVSVTVGDDSDHDTTRIQTAAMEALSRNMSLEMSTTTAADSNSLPVKNNNTRLQNNSTATRRTTPRFVFNTQQPHLGREGNSEDARVRQEIQQQSSFSSNPMLARMMMMASQQQQNQQNQKNSTNGSLSSAPTPQQNQDRIRHQARPFDPCVSLCPSVPQFQQNSLSEHIFISKLIAYASSPSADRLYDVVKFTKEHELEEKRKDNNVGSSSSGVGAGSSSFQQQHQRIFDTSSMAVSSLATAALGLWRWSQPENENNNNEEEQTSTTVTRTELFRIQQHLQPFFVKQECVRWLERVIEVADDYFGVYLIEEWKKTTKDKNNKNNSNEPPLEAILEPEEFYLKRYKVDFKTATMGVVLKDEDDEKVKSENEDFTDDYETSDDTSSDSSDSSDSSEDDEDSELGTTGKNRSRNTKRHSSKKQSSSTRAGGAPKYQTKADLFETFKLDLGLQRSELVPYEKNNNNENKNEKALLSDESTSTSMMMQQQQQQQQNNSDFDEDFLLLSSDDEEDDKNHPDYLLNNNNNKKEDPSLTAGTEVVDEVVTMNNNKHDDNNNNSKNSNNKKPLVGADLMKHRAENSSFEDVTYLLEADFQLVSQSCVLWFDETMLRRIVSGGAGENNNNLDYFMNNDDSASSSPTTKSDEQQQQQSLSNNKKDYLTVNNNMLRKSLQEELGDGGFTVTNKLHTRIGQKAAAIFAKQAVSHDLCQAACSVLRSAATTNNLRYKTNGGLEPPKTGIVGYYDYLRNPTRKKCRLTAFAQKHLETMEELVAPLIWRLHEIYKLRAPNHFAQQNSMIPPQHRLFDTCFSTITVNDTFRTAQHTDSGDFKSGMGLVAVLGGNWHGCHLALPSTGKAFKMQVGDVLLFDTSLPHGNTEWDVRFPTASRPSDPNDWRVSIVVYLRSGLMSQTCEEENERKQIAMAKKALYVEKKLNNIRSSLTSLMALSQSSSNPANKLVDLMYFSNSGDQHFAEFETPPLWLPPKLVQTLNEPQKCALLFAHRRLMKKTGCVLALSMGIGKSLLGLSIAFSQLVLAGGGGVGSTIGGFNRNHHQEETSSSSGAAGSSSNINNNNNNNTNNSSVTNFRPRNLLRINYNSLNQTTSTAGHGTGYDNSAFNPFRYCLVLTPKSVIPHWQNEAERKWSGEHGLKFAKIFVNNNDTTAGRDEFDRQISEFFGYANEYSDAQAKENRLNFMKQCQEYLEEEEKLREQRRRESKHDSSTSSSTKPSINLNGPRTSSQPPNRPILLNNGAVPAALIIINPDYLKRFLQIKNIPEPSLILFDEGHRGSSSSTASMTSSAAAMSTLTQPTTGGENARNSYSTLFLLNKYFSTCTSRIVLSGTPLQNATIELYRVIDWVNPISTRLLSEVSFKNAVAPLDDFLKTHTATSTSSSSSSNVVVGSAFIKDYFEEEDEEDTNETNLLQDDDGASLVHKKKKQPFIFDRKEHAAAVRAQEFLASWMRGSVFRAKISSRSSLTATLKMPELKDYVVVCTWSPAQLTWLLLLTVAKRMKFVLMKENNDKKKKKSRSNNEQNVYDTPEVELQAIRQEISNLFEEHDDYFKEVIERKYPNRKKRSANDVEDDDDSNSMMMLNNKNKNNNQNQHQHHLFVPSLVYEAFLSSSPNGPGRPSSKFNRSTKLNDDDTDDDDIDDESSASGNSSSSSSDDEDDDVSSTTRLLLDDEERESLSNQQQQQDSAPRNRQNQHSRNGNRRSHRRNHKIISNSASLLSSFSVGASESHRVTHLTCHPNALAQYDHIRYGVPFSWGNRSEVLATLAHEYLIDVEIDHQQQQQDQDENNSNYSTGFGGENQTLLKKLLSKKKNDSNTNGVKQVSFGTSMMNDNNNADDDDMQRRREREEEDDDEYNCLLSMLESPIKSNQYVNPNNIIQQQGQDRKHITMMMNNNNMKTKNDDNTLIDHHHHLVNGVKSFVQHSNKLSVLLQIALTTTKVKNESLIVFTQYRSTMACIYNTLCLAGITTFMLHGDMTTSQREYCVDEFNNNDQNQNNQKSSSSSSSSDGKVLVLMTKVGGVGIDLTSASTAVMFEPWWNPQVDLQAIARIFRPTQRAPLVTVYRLCVEGTLEETILLETQLRKLALFACVVDRAKPQGAASGNQEVLIDLQEDQYPEVLRMMNQSSREEKYQRQQYYSNNNSNSSNNNTNNNQNQNDNVPLENLLGKIASPELSGYCEMMKRKKLPISRVFDFSDLERLMDQAL